MHARKSAYLCIYVQSGHGHHTHIPRGVFPSSKLIAHLGGVSVWRSQDPLDADGIDRR